MPAANSTAEKVITFLNQDQMRTICGLVLATLAFLPSPFTSAHAAPPAPRKDWGDKATCFRYFSNYINDMAFLFRTEFLYGRTDGSVSMDDNSASSQAVIARFDSLNKPGTGFGIEGSLRSMKHYCEQSSTARKVIEIYFGVDPLQFTSPTK